MAVNETKVTKIFVGPTAPTVNKNLIWCDTSKNYQLKKFIGTSDGADQWKVLAASEASAITIEENGQKYILQDYVLALATELDNKANTSDLSNYLPLTGGTIRGDVYDILTIIDTDISGSNYIGYNTNNGITLNGQYEGGDQNTHYVSTHIGPSGITGDAVTSSITSGSNKLLTSGGAYTALQNKVNVSDLDNYLKKTGDTHLELGNLNSSGSAVILGSNFAEEGEDFYGDRIELRGNGINVIIPDHGGTEIDGHKISINSPDNEIYISTDSGFTGTFIDTNLATELEDGHIASSKAIKSYVDTLVSNKADNTNVVHLSGDEVITGNKLFTSSIRFSSNDTFNTNLAAVSVEPPVYNPGTPPTLIIDSNSNITIDTSTAIDTGLYYSYGIISGVNPDGETFRIDGKYGSASFSSLSTGSISGSAIVSTIGTSTTSTKLPTEGAVVKAISDVKTSLGSALTYEGSVENYSNLPTDLTASDKGKVYNVVNANGNIPAGTNYAWNGTSWDPLGGDYTALKDYIDDNLDDKITKNTDAELNAFIMPTYNSSGVQNGKAKIMLYKDDTTGAITIEAEEITE